MLRRRAHPSLPDNANERLTGGQNLHDDFSQPGQLRGGRLRRLRRVLTLLKGLTWFLLLAALIAVLGQSVLSPMGE